MKNAWLNVAVERPWLVLLTGLVVIIAAALGTENLYFRGDYKIFFEPDNPQRVAFEQMQDTFSKNDGASIIIAPKSGDVFDQGSLQLIVELTEAAELTPYSSRVDSLANFQHTWSEEDDLIVEDLIAFPRYLSSTDIEKIKAFALNEPDLVNRLISSKGDVTVINISVNLPDGDQTKEVQEIAEFVLTMTENFSKSYPEFEFYHTGVVFMSHSFAQAAKQDFETIVPLMFFTVIVIMWLMIKSLSATFATLVIISTSIAVTMGIAGWLGMFISTATVNVPTMIMTLAVADSVHVLASMIFRMRQGLTKSEALLDSIALNKQPIFITSVTTAIGFLTLNFSDVPILADLGNLTAVGVLVACLFSLTILPALIMILPINIKPLNIENTPHFIEKLGLWVIEHRKTLLPASFVVTALFIGFCFDNKLNDSPTAYFDKSTNFRQSTDFQQQHVSGMTSMDFAIYTGQESAINDPKNLKIVEDFVIWLKDQQAIDHVSSVTDTFKRLNKNMHQDNQAYYVLPEDKELAAQFMLLYEMSLPYGMDLNNHLDMDKSATRLMVMLQNIGSHELLAIEKKAQLWFAQRAPELQLSVSSPGLMFAHISDINMSSMLKGSVLALILISGLLIFALRSLKMGLISLIPNLVPACIGFGLWGLYSGQVNLGLSVVLSMTLGIIVDDTVHFLSKYNRAREQGNDATESVKYAFSSVGKALWTTTVILCIGFLVLVLSPFALNSEMGLLTAIIILVALAVDFIFLPPFLIKFDNRIRQE